MLCVWCGFTSLKSQVCTLGVLFLDVQVMVMVKSGFYHFRLLHPSLDRNDLAMVIRVFVLHRLDYCNDLSMELMSTQQHPQV